MKIGRRRRRDNALSLSSTTIPNDVNSQNGEKNGASRRRRDRKGKGTYARKPKSR